MSGWLVSSILGFGVCVGFIGGAVWASIPRDDDDDDMDWGAFT